jgi:hypothetical protein
MSLAFARVVFEGFFMTGRVDQVLLLMPMYQYSMRATCRRPCPLRYRAPGLERVFSACFKFYRVTQKRNPQ